jgi:hypothetical protein
MRLVAQISASLSVILIVRHAFGCGFCRGEKGEGVFALRR